MNINRRGFIFGSVAAASLAGCATGKTGLRALKPGEKRTIAMIGCGSQMRSTLIPCFLDPQSAPNVRIAAVCDCDVVRAKGCAKQVDDVQGVGTCKIVLDFREVLADPSIDMVCVATPDHWHAYICIEAMRRGKDVYCEKPLAWSVQETKELVKAERKFGRIFQTGSMQRSSREFRDAVALVRGGLIGNVWYVDVNFGHADAKLGGPSQPVRFWDDPKNAAAEGAPNPDVDWTMWLGPAAMRPYSDQLAPRGIHMFYPMFWRCDDDLASGYCGDWGAHHLDIAQWGLDMDRSGPYRVIRSDEPHSTDLFHGGRRQFGVRMLFKKPYGDVELYHGPFSLVKGEEHGWGTVFYGDKGIVAVNREKIAVWTGTGLVKPTRDIRRKLQTCEFMPEKIATSSIRSLVGDPSLEASLSFIEKKYADVIARAGLYRSERYARDFSLKPPTMPDWLYRTAQHVRDFCACVESRQPPITPAETGGRACALCLLANMSYKHDVGFDWDPERMEFANGTGKGIPLSRPGDSNGWEAKA